jgi:hypothetical protein
MIFRGWNFSSMNSSWIDFSSMDLNGINSISMDSGSMSTENFSEFGHVKLWNCLHDFPNGTTTMYNYSSPSIPTCKCVATFQADSDIGGPGVSQPHKIDFL